MKPTSTTKNDASLNSDEGSFNGNFTAIPKDSSAGVLPDADLQATGIDFGEMNEEDAREAGYTTSTGKAVEMALPDVEGSPTGAFTDVGAGRSSVVHKH